MDDKDTTNSKTAEEQMAALANAVPINWEEGRAAALDLEALEQDASRVYAFVSHISVGFRHREIDHAVIMQDQARDFKSPLFQRARLVNFYDTNCSSDHVDSQYYYHARGNIDLALVNLLPYTGEKNVLYSMVIDKYPDRFFKYVEGKGYEITKAYPGIYYAEEQDSGSLFQALVLSELQPAHSKWLLYARKGLSWDERIPFYGRVRELRIEAENVDQDDTNAVRDAQEKLELADVLENFLAKTNGDKMERVRTTMGREFMNLIQPDLDVAREEGRIEVRTEVRTEVRERVATKMLKRNEPMDKILDYSALAEQRILEIAQKLQIAPNYATL